MIIVIYKLKKSKMDFFINTNMVVSSFLNDFVITYHLEKIIWITADCIIFLIPIFFLFSRLYWTFKDEKKTIKDEKKSWLLNIFYWSSFSIIINLIIQHIVFEQRPDTFIKPILQHVPDNSFPSDHAALSFAFIIWLYFFWYKKIFFIWLPLILIMDFSRIAWWLHWFFDIIVWIIIWFMAMFFVYKIRKNKIVRKTNDFIIKIASLVRL